MLDITSQGNAKHNHNRMALIKKKRKIISVGKDVEKPTLRLEP